MSAYKSIFVILLFLVDNYVCSIYTDLSRNSVACGRPNTIYGRIVGGYKVGYYKYPWFASLRTIYSNRLTCGGSLITSLHVLTAAHCFENDINNPESQYKVELGFYNSCTAAPNSRLYETKKVIIHELYDIHAPLYDIAIITLDRETHLTPVCLPKPTSLLHPSRLPNEGIVIGLGVTENSVTNTPCTLHEARVLIYTYAYCENILAQIALENEDKDQTVGPNVICAGYIEGGIDACQGDSGGPLLVLGSNGRYIQQGIVSYGYGCALKGLPGFYTDVARYVTWIELRTKQNVTKTPTNPINEWRKYWEKFYDYLYSFLYD